MKFRKLRHRVIIEEEQQVSDGQGGWIITWVTFDTVWSQVLPLRGNELYQAQQINPEISHKVKMRYRNDLVPTMRLKHESRIFDILAIIDVGELDKELEILCIER